MSLRKIFVVTGGQHEKKIGFCSCESNAATLVSLGLWPGSPTNPIVAFSIKFMDICLRFLLEAHVSLNKFCDAMSVFQTSLLPKYVSFELEICAVIDIAPTSRSLSKYGTVPCVTPLGP